jgi:hypothetical protein
MPHLQYKTFIVALQIHGFSLATSKKIGFRMRTLQLQTVTTLFHRMVYSSVFVTAIGCMELFHTATAGPTAYGICQAGCSAVVMACYTAGGFTWGATLGATAPTTIVGCNTAFDTFQAACAAVLLVPTP